jgi:hypothetical protein
LSPDLLKKRGHLFDIDELLFKALVLTDPLEMLLPREIPSEISVAEWSVLLQGRGIMLSTQEAAGTFTHPAMMAEVRHMLSNVPAAGRAVLAMDSVADDLAHDSYFHVQRVESDAPHVFVRMAIQARLSFLREVDEAPVTIAHTHLDLIDRALADLLSCLAGGVVNGSSTITEWESRGNYYHAKRRWIRGHQVFAALTQGLIFSFQSLGRALRLGKNAEVRKWADLSISLLRGSAAAFELTGDFPVEEYANTVRPSMMPPESEVGLSGLMSIDHRVLAQTMRDMRPALKALSEQEPARHDGIAAALSAVYDSHIHVCERFVGARPSILTAGRTKKSGPSLIEQFKTLRLKPFEQVTRAPRLTNGAHQSVGGGCPFHE